METRFTHDAAFKRKVFLCHEKIGNRAASRKYTVSEACVHHWRNLNTKLFPCQTNTKAFTRPRKWRNPEIEASVLEHFKDIRNTG
jgi:hypothetical protein